MRAFTRRWLALVSSVTLVGTLINACSASRGTPGTSQGTGGASSAGGGDSTGSLITSSGTGGDPTITSGNGGSGGLAPDAGCAKTSSEATSKPQPADIILAIDTSGSMAEESAQVQAHLNDFASIIINSGIDVHVILLADDSVCIPAPLGNGACNGGDEKLPAYRHVLETINSTDGLQKFITTYPQWKDALRPDASKTFAIVSDDDSDLSAADFTAQLMALDPPTFQKFKFDAIVSFDDPGVCTGCIFGGCAACVSKCCDKNLFCAPISAAEGKVYKQLVTQTMGVIGDLCTENFAPVFMDMATAVVQGSTISCSYDIPVPDGGMIDPGKVNVSYTPGGGGPSSSILNVPGGAAGCGVKGGWYYDDPVAPTKITMCPTTCAALQGDPDGKVDVIFGCETVIKPPE